MRFALVHSPAVGPTTWGWVAESLRTRGHDVVVPDLVAAARSGDPNRFARAAASAITGERGGGRILVGHSGAGPVLPVIAVATDAPLVVFVDSGLPPTAAPFTAGGDFLPTLRALAIEGRLPKWSEWFGPGVLPALIHDEARRAAVERELPQIPLAFYEAVIHLPDGWRDRTGAYVLLSEAYRADADRARALGWPIVERRGGHLDIVDEAAVIAESLVTLAAESSCT